MVNIYAFLENLNIPTTTIQLPNELTPNYNYALINELQSSNPYNSVGTAWIDSSGKIVLYTITENKRIYLSGNYIIFN